VKKTVDNQFNSGDIIEMRAYSKMFKNEIVIFRAYIYGDITEELLQTIGIIDTLPLSGKISPTIHIIGNVKPFHSKLIQISPADPHQWNDIKSLKDKVVFILIHGINPEEILSPDPDQYDIWMTPYKYHVWNTAHNAIYGNIENSVIIHYIYPSSMKRLEENAYQLIAHLQRTDIDKARAVFMIGHSMGGLVTRKALQRSQWLRDITTHVFTLNTPHRGSPLASLMFAPKDFWENIESSASEENYGKIMAMKMAIVMTYHNAGIMSQGYLDLRWDHLDNLSPFPLMISKDIYNLNMNEEYHEYSFTMSLIPRKNLVYPIMKIVDKLYYEPKDHIGLIMMQMLMEMFGDIIGTGLWYEGDGLVPISSQIPVKYIEYDFTFNTIGPFKGDHIDIFTNRGVWRKLMDTVATILGNH